VACGACSRLRCELLSAHTKTHTHTQHRVPALAAAWPIQLPCVLCKPGNSSARDTPVLPMQAAAMRRGARAASSTAAGHSRSLPLSLLDARMCTSQRHVPHCSPHTCMHAPIRPPAPHVGRSALTASVHRSLCHRHHHATPTRAASPRLCSTTARRCPTTTTWTQTPPTAAAATSRCARVGVRALLRAAAGSGLQGWWCAREMLLHADSNAPG
jgi:hypothetical protein